MIWCYNVPAIRSLILAHRAKKERQLAASDTYTTVSIGTNGTVAESQDKVAMEDMRKGSSATASSTARLSPDDLA